MNLTSCVHKIAKVLHNPKIIQYRFLEHKIRKQINKEYVKWFRHHYPNSQVIEKQKKQSELFNYRPLISIITPIYNTDPKYLIKCFESIINQSYSKWELCLVDDASTIPICRKIVLKYFDKFPDKIKYKFRDNNGHICQASNDAINMATGEYIAFVDHDDFLWPNALYEVVKEINQDIKSLFIYSDEDKLEEDGVTHSDPFFKPDWDPFYLSSINYITHFSVIKKSLLISTGKFKQGYEGAQDWDLFLRITENMTLKQQTHIHHIPTVLYSWRKSPTSTASEKYSSNTKLYAYENQHQALSDHFKRIYKNIHINHSPFMGLWILNFQKRKENKRTNFKTIKNQSLEPLTPNWKNILNGLLDNFPDYIIIPKIVNHNNLVVGTNLLPYYPDNLLQSFPLTHWKDSFHSEIINDSRTYPILFYQNKMIPSFPAKTIYTPNIVFRITQNSYIEKSDYLTKINPNLSVNLNLLKPQINI